MRIVLAYIWDYITTRDLPTNLVYKDTISISVAELRGPRQSINW